MISAMSYDTGMGYSATITQISDYPLEGNYYSGSGNSNSSNYEFTAVLDGSEGLSNGMYLELTLNLAGDTDASAFYLYKPYIREDEGGSYVMKVGPDNRLYKQYLSPVSYTHLAGPGHPGVRAYHHPIKTLHSKKDPAACQVLFLLRNWIYFSDFSLPRARRASWSARSFHWLPEWPFTFTKESCKRPMACLHRAA